jgi:hypothetical protein
VTEGFQRLFDTADAQRRAGRGRAANASGATGRAHARDVIIGHLAPGEIVVPPRAQTEIVLRALRDELGDQLPRFTVGSGHERRNPVSGLPAFSPENEDDDQEGFSRSKLLEVIFGSSVRRQGPATQAAARATRPRRTTWAFFF